MTDVVLELRSDGFVYDNTGAQIGYATKENCRVLEDSGELAVKTLIQLKGSGYTAEEIIKLKGSGVL